MFVDEGAIGTQLRCENCKMDPKSKKGSQQQSSGEHDEEGDSRTQLKGHCFATTNPEFWCNWAHWSIPIDIPIFFQRCAVTRDLFDLLIELCPSSTAGGLAENIRRKSQFKWLLCTMNLLVIGVSVSFDNTFRAAGKALVTSADKQKIKVLKGGIISLMNENGEIIGWVSPPVLILLSRSPYNNQQFCHGQSNTEISELLDGLKTRCKELHVPPPEIFIADNCCHVRSAVTVIFPQASMKLDIWHFIMRQVPILLWLLVYTHQNK
ncbi:hypothetical protein CY34DRAFT_101869 [Suillus luteus UH-Slu-Lm8-n1]|uniref:Uncharacterized protein n=1 Tax=Suillus luteus UH-Slu-Lm8-n1 TaxID=930992 RepID=A0A0D0ADE5_9AGAM|nr:hypothetical protein CY34DRAFT_101869 [Suillus luteus UH-Slu-Lm8-n1]